MSILSQAREAVGPKGREDHWFQNIRRAHSREEFRFGPGKNWSPAQ